MNKRLFFSISLVLVLCLASNASAGIKGYWNFNDGTANDSSGWNHHGTFMFDATTVIDGNIPGLGAGNRALIVDGNEDYVNVGGDAYDVDPNWGDFTTNQMTVACWVKLPDGYTNNYQPAMAKAESWQWYRNYNGSGIRLYTTGTTDTYINYNPNSDFPLIHLSDGQWHHTAATFDGVGEMRHIWIDGYHAYQEKVVSGGFAVSTHAVSIGARLQYANRWQGLLDECYLYDSVVSDVTIKMWAARYEAYDPVPEDGAVYQEKTLAQVSWTGMPMTFGYRVYLGTDFNDVNDGVAGVDKGAVSTMYYSGAPMGALKLGTVYYWRVDSDRGGGNIIEGDVWQFETKPAWAENPYPVDTCKYVGLAKQLTWLGGDSVIKSEVYLSTDQQWVADACEAVHVATINAPDPCVFNSALAADTTYYWKVDSNTGTVYTKGSVWSFSTDTPSPEPGMFGFWPMEEDDVASGSSTWDISGKEHHGIFVQGDPDSSIDIVVDAERGNVLRVDNLASPLVNSALDCGGGPDDIHDPCWGYVAQDQITVALWAKMEEGHTTDYIFTIGNTTQYCRAMGTDLDEIRLFNQNVLPTTIFGKTLWENKWHWVVLTYDNDVNERKVYVDGRLETSETDADGSLGVHSDSVVIGGRLNDAYNYRGFDGWIDDVKLYDIVLPCWKIVAEGTQCATCVGDLDANSVVNLADLNQLVGDLTMAKIDSGQWLITKTLNPTYWKNCSDMDADDDIDLADLNRMVGNLTWEKIMAGNWFYPCGKYCP